MNSVPKKWARSEEVVLCKEALRVAKAAIATIYSDKGHP
jgi:hypothetical protein